MSGSQTTASTCPMQSRHLPLDMLYFQSNLPGQISHSLLLPASDHYKLNCWASYDCLSWWSVSLGPSQHDSVLSLLSYHQQLLGPLSPIIPLSTACKHSDQLLTYCFTWCLLMVEFQGLITSLYYFERLWWNIWF